MGIAIAAQSPRHVQVVVAAKVDAFSVGPHNAKLYRVDRHEIDDGIVVRAAFASRIAKRTA